MDRLSQLRGDAGTSRDSSLDTSQPAEAYMTANESSSKYFSLSDPDSNFSLSPAKELTDNVDGAASDSERIISNLSPIPKSKDLDSFKIGAQIEAANILSGGVNIFDDNENSYDEDELVIDDAVQDGDDKAELKLSDGSDLPFEKTDRVIDNSLEDVEAASPSKDTEVVLQIDGKNVDAIDIGNGLYLYRKDGEEKLAAVQIFDDDQQQPNIKFLKVRENTEGNLEVYEEIEIEVPKEMPTPEGKTVKSSSQTSAKDVNNEHICNKDAERKNQVQLKDTTVCEVESDLNKDNPAEPKTEVNLNGKTMKFSESRKSPLIGTFTPMTYHSTPNKEGIPLTKTMVDLQLHPNRHSENVKKTIEVHTDSCKQRLLDTPTKSNKDEHSKCSENFSISTSNDIITKKESQNGQNDSKTNDNVEIEKATLIASEVKSILEKNDQKSFDSKNVDTKEDDKTETSVIEMSSQLAKPKVDEGAQCILNTSNLKEKHVENDKGIELLEKCNASNDVFKEKSSFDGSSLTTINDIDRSEVSPNVTDKKEVEEKINKDLQSENREIKEEHNISTSTSNDLLITQTSIINDVITSNTEPHKNEQISANILENNTVAEEFKCLDKEVELDTVSDLNVKNLETCETDIKFLKNSFDKEMKTQVDKEITVGDCTLNEIKSNNNVEIKTSETLSVQNSEMEVKEKTLDVKDLNSKELLKSPENILSPQHEQNVDKKTECSLTNTVKDVSNEAIEKPFLKPPTENVVQITSQEEDLKNFTMLDNAKKESLVHSCREITATNTVTEVKKPVKTDIETNEDMNIRNTTTTEIQNKADSSSAGEATNKDAEFMQPKNNCPTNTETNNQSESNSDKNHPINSLITKKKDTTISVNKLESNKKLPTDCEKMNNSGLNTSHSSQNIQKQVEESKHVTKNELTKLNATKPINNKTAVPFGMWTETHRQEFLNKIKEAKVPTNTSNTKQLKQPNDLNRRDVLQKIDSQRQSNIASIKVQELSSINKHKNEGTAFVSKSNITQKEKSEDIKSSNSKTEGSISKSQVDLKIGQDQKLDKDFSVHSGDIVDMSSIALNIKKDVLRRKGLNAQDLIDKTVEGIINRASTVTFNQDYVKQNTELLDKPDNASTFTPVSLDEIESKMNELHGIPFVERPPHELPKVFDVENKTTTHEVSTSGATHKVPNLIPFNSKSQQKTEQNPRHSTKKVIEESDDEIIEHEPITGDKEFNKKKSFAYSPMKSKIQSQEIIDSNTKKETIITEKDFDKFARRNSITYENCLTVNYDTKEQPNVVHTVVEKEIVPKKLSRNEIMLAESKAKSNKHLAMRHNNHPSKIPTLIKATSDEDSYCKNYQSKVQIAYHSAMTAKRQQECPITIIEDKPVKVVFMDTNTEFTPNQLNIQGKELSPKKSTVDWDFTHSNSESLDSDILEAGSDGKLQDDTKLKSKHQRKQVLTPVETPELELIEPSDLGIEVSPRKKRKAEENKNEKNCKTLVPKKSYLLNRNIATEEAPSSPQDLTKAALKNTENKEDIFIKHSGAISAIDNLVKAAELLETQSEIKHVLPPNDQNSPTQQNTPTKRGRGRPRKYPLPDPDIESKSPSPVKTPTSQKKPRLIDAKIKKSETESEDDSTSSDGELVKENWTMGKINENIVCPICNKLFRSENVVFKHVKHCTGPSPSRSDSDKRSPRRMRQSQELDWKSEGSKSDSIDINEGDETNKPRKKRKSKEENPKRYSVEDNSDIVIIEDTPIKDILEKQENIKHESNKTIKRTNVKHKNNSLVCEFCGKIFRQLSYLVNHKLQHKNIESKKVEKEKVHKSLFSCEICKKEFRKLHHLVQHRIIHNPNSTRVSRRSSSEQSENKVVKDAKSSEDQSAGFRCEPCDKSFRKLHHLVEHRETHDEMNKKCNTTTVSTIDTIKANPLHNCDVCKKSFKKLQHLIEHKENHLDTSSEKSDDKSVKSSLSTKDIIHECPLCYMVFPNEHSLNKHNIICQRKKKQSAAKQSKKLEDKDTVEESPKGEADTDNDTCVVIDDIPPIITEEQESIVKETVKPEEDKEVKNAENIFKEVKVIQDISFVKVPIIVKEKDTNEKYEEPPKIDKQIKPKKQAISSEEPEEIIKKSETYSLKKKLPVKDKVGEKVTKRIKSANVSLPPLSPENKSVDTSDEDEIRYMINPDFMDDSREGKLFMKVRSMKRNSLQIEQPKSKSLVKRSISLQHPPKIPRLKVKPVPRKPNMNTNTVVKNTKAVSVHSDPVQSTDSDDSDVKYSFPVSIKKEGAKNEKNAKRQTVVAKRKSLSNIVKRKSSAKMKRISLTKPIKKRSAQPDLRCDCGQQFSSAALLARHAVLAHTPPRVRRRRSPPPEKPASVPRRAVTAESGNSGVAKRKSSVAGDTNGTDSKKSTKADSAVDDVKPATRKSSISGGAKIPELKKQGRSDPAAGGAKPGTRKSSGNGDAKATGSRRLIRTDPASEGAEPVARKFSVTGEKKANEARKRTESESGGRSRSGVATRKSSVSGDSKAIGEARKMRRNAPPHRGVPVPEKMRKLMEKSKK